MTTKKFSVFYSLGQSLFKFFENKDIIALSMVCKKLQNIKKNPLSLHQVLSFLEKWRVEYTERWEDHIFIPDSLDWNLVSTYYWGNICSVVNTVIDNFRSGPITTNDFILLQPHLRVAMNDLVSVMYRNEEGQYEFRYEFDDLNFEDEFRTVEDDFRCRIWDDYEYNHNSTCFMNYLHCDLEEDEVTFFFLSRYRWQTIEKETMAFAINGHIRWVGHDLRSMLHNDELMMYFLNKN
jgi:hypothetical protein